jgi:hypothetical protein
MSTITAHVQTAQLHPGFMAATSFPCQRNHQDPRREQPESLDALFNAVAGWSGMEQALRTSPQEKLTLLRNPRVRSKQNALVYMMLMAFLKTIWIAAYKAT